MDYEWLRVKLTYADGKWNPDGEWCAQASLEYSYEAARLYTNCLPSHSTLNILRRALSPIGCVWVVTTMHRT